MLTETEILDRFENVRASGDGWSALCGAHEDSRPSLSIDHGTKQPWVFRCHAGCSVAAILNAAGLTLADVSEPNNNGRHSRAISETYDYRDETGTLLFQTVRYTPKGFSQRRPDGDSGWIHNIQGVRRVLYRLPELHGRTQACILEGEKDANRLWASGIAATTNVGGAGKWKPDYVAQLTAAGIRKVVIIPDNDDPGRAHAEAVARSCHAAGLQVKLVTLPDLPPKGDVSDFLETHTIDDLRALAKSTPIFSTSLAIYPSVATDAETPSPLADLLGTIERWIRHFVVVSQEQADAIALWTAHTHAIEAAECTPYLQVTSATARAGKTRLLEVLEPIVARPWYTGRTTHAALVRKINAEAPTLLLDESDAAFRGPQDYAEALRGVLNTGYRASGKTTMCIGQGANIHAHDFRTFCPKVIAGIGDLPGTIADRSIRIELRRRTASEACGRWRERSGRHAARPIAGALARWATPAVIDGLRDARPALPAALNDRAMDVWEPLFAIAELAGGVWPERARRAAKQLSGDVADTRDINVELLQDIRKVFQEENVPFLGSTVLVEKLAAMEDRPWADWRQGKPITPRAVADRLRLFGIFAVHNVTKTLRGYYRDRFVDVWSRYPPDPEIEPSMRPNHNEYGPESPKSKCPAPKTADDSKTQETSINTDILDAWTVRNPDLGNRRVRDTDPESSVPTSRDTEVPPDGCF